MRRRSLKPEPYYEKDGITIYHGDCLELLPLMPRAVVVLTDPPYGVGLKYGREYDDSRKDYWDWMRERLAVMRAAARSTVFTHRVAALRELPTDWDWVGVWHKPRTSAHRIGNANVIPTHEPIFMYDLHGHGDRPSEACMMDVVTCNTARGYVNAPKRNTDISHPVPKPIELFKQLIKNFSRPGDLIIDPFAGSGTTLVAARDMGRRAIGMEIEEAYCEAITHRLARPRLSFQPAITRPKRKRLIDA